MPRKYPKSVVPSGPKKLECSTVLPGIFDTLWDAKTGSDLFLDKKCDSVVQEIGRLVGKLNDGSYRGFGWVEPVKSCGVWQESVEEHSRRITQWLLRGR